MAQGDWTEKIKVEGEKLVEEVERLVHEGNVRHLILRHDGNVVMELPVNAGVAMALLAPSFAAIAAIGALVTHCTIEVVRTGV